MQIRTCITCARSRKSEFLRHPGSLLGGLAEVDRN